LSKKQGCQKVFGFGLGVHNRITILLFQLQFDIVSQKFGKIALPNLDKFQTRFLAKSYFNADSGVEQIAFSQ